MANAPDFLLMHCVTSNQPDCSTCARDYMIPLHAVAGFRRNLDGTATVYPKKDWIGSHHCISDNRECHTTASWAVLVALLNGAVGNMGDVTVNNV